MTATEVLRRLLDERGVEWWQKKRHTCWKVSKGQEVEMWRAWEAPDGSLTLKVDYIYGLTPEQAIAATLGAGTCHDKGNIERFICSECGCCLDLQDDDWEATMWLDGAAMVPNFCPNCGRKVVDA